MTIKGFRRRMVFFAALAACLSGCSHAVPEHAVESAWNLGFDLPPSVVSMKIDADLSKIRNFILPEVPEEMQSEQGAEFSWNFSRRDAELTLEDGRLRLVARYEGSIRTEKFFQTCSLDPVYPIVSIAMSPGISGNEDRWVFGAKDAELDIALGEGSETTCTIFRIDVASRLKEALNGKELKEKIRRRVEEAGISVPSRKVDRLLNSPIAVDAPDVKAKVCLYPQIETVTIGEFEGTLEKATVHAEAKGRPVAVIAATCRDDVESPSPRLATGVVGGGDFLAVAAVAVPYSQLNRQLREMEGEEFSFEGKTFHVRDIKAANASGDILISVRTKGYIDGDIHIWGKPAFGGGCSTIRLKDVRYAAKSGDWIDKAKIALGTFKEASIVRKIEAKAVFDISGYCETLRTGLDGEHKAGGLKVTIAVDDLQPTGEIVSRDDAVAGKLLIRGKASGEFGL